MLQEAGPNPSLPRRLRYPQWAQGSAVGTEESWVELLHGLLPSHSFCGDRILWGQEQAGISRMLPLG